MLCKNCPEFDNRFKRKSCEWISAKELIYKKGEVGCPFTKAQLRKRIKNVLKKY